MQGDNRFRLKATMSVLVALVCLLSFADFLPHTDDGCAVESHCLACRAHISAVTYLVGPPLVILGANEIVVLEARADERPLKNPVRLLPPGRAPPAKA